WTEAITTGSRWASAERGKSGVLSDPQASAVAAATAFAGKAIHRNRDEVATEMVPTGAPVAAAAADGLHASPEDAVAEVAQLARDYGAGRALSDDAAARIGAMLQDPGIRDDALGLLVTRDRDAVVAVCAAAARRLSGPARAAAATVYAMGAYIGGDGTRANVGI